MLPLPFEKAILRRTVPTWEDLLCSYIVQGAFTRADLSLLKCKRKLPEKAARCLGVPNALLIVSPGCDCNRLLFYLLLYVINPLHVYDSEASEYRVAVAADLPRAEPPLALYNADMALRSQVAYYSIFDLSSSESPEGEYTDRSLFPHIFTNLKLRSAVELRSRLVLVLGLEPDEAVVTARHFAQIIKRICHSTGDTPSNMSVRMPLPKFVDGTVLAAEREKMYIEGGIYCVPSRILLVDLLTSKILPELISGVVVVNAHRITKDYNIPFALKLIRGRNRLAFIKAISDNVGAMRTPGNLTFVLKSLFTKECFIFPRCSNSFDAVLNSTRLQPETFEVDFQLSDKAKQIHNTIVQVLQRLVTELQRNSNKELQQLDMNALMYSGNVKGLLENVLQKAHLVTSEFHVKRTMRSITNLRMLLNQLINMDALSFLAFAESLKTAELDSHWLWTPYGTTIYRLATSRVYEPTPETEAGLVLNVDTDLKGDYIRSILCSKHVGCEELGEMIRSAMQWHRCKRPWKGPVRYKTTSARSNMSYHLTRRALCRREAKHVRRICRFFECGGTLYRRALVVVDNNFLQSHLSSGLTMSLEKYNKLSFLEYASRRADRFEHSTREEEKFSAFAQAHFHRSFVNSRNETDKLLHKFVVWNTYNEIYRKNSQDDQPNDGYHPPGIPVGCIGDIRKDVSGGTVHEEHFYEEIATATTDVESYDDGENESDSEIIVKRNVPRKSSSGSQDASYSLTLGINKMLRCKTKVINVSHTQPRNEALKGIMARKLNADDAAEPLPVVCSPQEFGYVLHRVKPTLIVVYRPNIKVFRVIEQYCAQKFISGRRKYLRVYVLSYRDCIESHKFARDLKNELECWQYLHQEIKTLQVTFDESVLVKRDASDSNKLVMQDKFSQSPSARVTPPSTISIDTACSNTSSSTELHSTPVQIPPTDKSANLTPTYPGQVAIYNAGGGDMKPSPQVLIDMREFRSKLPYHLYCSGTQLVPLVLEMGDYLLTRDICVERKSLHDLVTSLNSGRLAQQAEELCSFYEFPFLLLEFDDQEAFHLSPCTDEHASGLNYIYSKLCILCCNYPKLRIIWSESPERSAAIFTALKAGRSEPDANANNAVIAQARAPHKAGEGGSEAIAIRRSPADINNRDALRILRKIPGVTSYNISEILSRVRSLRQLSEMNEEDLCRFLPEANAHAIYNFFNQSLR